MYKTILAKKKSRRINAIHYNGENLEEVKKFAGSTFKMEEGIPTITSLENTRELNIGDFVICGQAGEFYISSPESFNLNYHVIIGDVNGNDPFTAKTSEKFYHTYQFRETNYEEAVRFVNDQGIDGVTLLSDGPYGPYHITHPNRESYDIKDGDILITDGKHLHPCDKTIFISTYYGYGPEILNEGSDVDFCRIFRSGDPLFKGAYHHYIIEYPEDSPIFCLDDPEKFPVSKCLPIHFQEGARKEPNSIPGVSDISLLRIVLDHLKYINVGEFNNRQTDYAIEHLEAAIECLRQRKLIRQKRGVDGYNKV